MQKPNILAVISIFFLFICYRYSANLIQFYFTGFVLAFITKLWISKIYNLNQKTMEVKDINYKLTLLNAFKYSFRSWIVLIYIFKNLK